MRTWSGLACTGAARARSPPRTWRRAARSRGAQRLRRSRCAPGCDSRKQHGFRQAAALEHVGAIGQQRGGTPRDRAPRPPRAARRASG
jgi:hypothetical protein